LCRHSGALFSPAAGPNTPPLTALAVPGRAPGARFYGAYWCPTCQKQKDLFEASVDRLPYVECTPDGRNGVRNFDCVANDIKDYPTWIIEGRRHIGLLSVDGLAALSGFKKPAGGAGAAPAR
jgi:thiol-disulfide isomerase/thioredoxin